MSPPEPPTPWSTGLLLSLALCCGCQRSLPRVVQRQTDAATSPAAPASGPAAASEQVAADGGWRATGATQSFSTNGIPISADGTSAAADQPLATAAPPTSAITAGDAAVFDAGLSPHHPATGATRPELYVGSPQPAIHQTQYVAGATDRDMETLRQRLEQQTQVNAALTQAIVQLQRQTETHHKSIVQLAEELNARQARQDKVTEEILSLIDQMAGGPPRPAPPATGSAAASPASGGESQADGGNEK